MAKPHKFPKWAALAALVLTASACGGNKPGDIRVREAWVRLPAVKGEAGAAYFRIEGGAEGTQLTGLSTPMARRIELHETMAEGMMTGMKPLKSVEFDYRGRILFEPGAKHAMLFGLAASVQPGTTLPLTFAFNAAPPVTIDAEVRDAAGESHARP